MISIIEQEYKWCSNGMQEDKKALYMPVLSGIIININKNKLLINTGVFLVDSGAAISILGPKYTKLFQDDTPCDSQRLQYVGVDEEKIRNIYKAKIKIEGFSFDLRVAIEEEFNLNFNHNSAY